MSRGKAGVRGVQPRFPAARREDNRDVKHSIFSLSCLEPGPLARNSPGHTPVEPLKRILSSVARQRWANRQVVWNFCLGWV